MTRADPPRSIVMNSGLVVTGSILVMSRNFFDRSGEDRLSEPGSVIRISIDKVLRKTQPKSRLPELTPQD